MFGFEKKPVSFKFGDKECLLSPYKSPVPPEIMPYYKKLELSSAENARISEFFREVPSVLKIGGAKQSYYVAKWPNGLPNILSIFKNGNAAGALINAGGKVAVQASLVSLVQTGFSLLVAIMRFFLGDTNRQLTVINQKIDEILEVLYGDKRAELISAIRFTRDAYENFSSIMEHDGQRNATIHNLQSARMTAMQDVEFYLSDLHSTVSKYNGNNNRFPDKIPEMERIVSKAIQSSECLDLSVQLYMTTNLMEIYYSQNYDPKYLRSVENSVRSDISRCEKQMIGDFNALKASLVHQWQKKADWDKDKEKIHALVQQVEQKLEPLMNDKGNALKAQFRKALRSIEKETECCIGADGTVYLKVDD